MPEKVIEWPVTTHAYVMVPGQVKAKERKGFEQEWVAKQAQEAARDGEILVLTMSPSAA